MNCYIIIFFNIKARQELLCNDLTEAAAKELCGYLRLNVAEGESFTEILIKNMSLHESISRAWMNVVRCPHDGEYNLVNHELGESVLLNGVEVTYTSLHVYDYSP